MANQTGRGGRREGAGCKPALVVQLGGALEEMDVHLEAARAVMRRWRQALLTARGPYAGQFAAPQMPSYGVELRRARRRVALVPVPARRRRIR